jgi:hypothetical protein
MCPTVELSRLGRAALQYATQFGFAILPLHSISPDRGCACWLSNCPSPGKHPCSEHGLKNASKKAAEIGRWWRRWSEANIGIATGAGSAVIVLDVDPRHGVISESYERDVLLADEKQGVSIQLRELHEVGEAVNRAVALLEACAAGDDG